MGYQSFGDEKGDSDSLRKLACLRIPDELHGKSFLDIGCNEGYFCVEAQTRGARSVVGIDQNGTFVRNARLRAPGIDYREQSWDELPKGPHDVILMASALHYSKDPKRLLNDIRDALADDGLFILEMGVVVDSSTSGKTWLQVQRGSDVLSFPNWLLVTEELLCDFAVRVMGPSVRQAGDPVPRFVFHCRKMKPIVLLCGGQSGIGKTTLSLECKKLSMTTFSTDSALMEMARYKHAPASALYRLVREKFEYDRIGELVSDIVGLGMGLELARSLFEMFPKGERISMIEGYALHFDEVRAELTRLLKPGFKVWSLSTENG